MKDEPLAPAGKTCADLSPRRSKSLQRIMVVEKKEDLRQLNAEVLVDAGYQVELAEDGEAAWAALQFRRFDLLITGQFLPKVSGVELLKKIHRASLPLPVIMATEILPTWELALHPCLRAVTLLHQPYCMDKLVGLVASVLLGTALGFAENVPAANRQGQLSANRLRL